MLIVSIDEKEYLRLGLLLEQTFPEARMQMISSVINPSGAKRDDVFSRADEYIYFLMFGNSHVIHPRGDGKEREVRWWYLRRTDVTSKRGTTKGGKAQFYPIYVDISSGRISKIGEALAPDDPIDSVPEVPGSIPVFPIRDDGLHMNWGVTASTLKRLNELGLVRVTPGHDYQPYIFTYLSLNSLPKIKDGRWEVRGEREDGSKIVISTEGKVTRATTAWTIPSHDAGQYGSQLLREILGGRRFPFPKSLYAVEDALRFFIANNPNAVMLDFFAGSGTTVHAVMRLNRQDGGSRQCISVTNNEVSADEQKALRKKGLRPGDPNWEALGICEYITKPRITAALTGKTPEGKPIKGDYKFNDEFPMAEGFEENVEFFKLTYEALRPVAHHRSFQAIAPLLWLRAGTRGRRIDKATDSYDIADSYGILFDLDSADDFLEAIAEAGSVRMTFIVTDNDRGFQAVCTELPARVEAVRLYESYLTNFTINTGRD